VNLYSASSIKNSQTRHLHISTLKQPCLKSTLELFPGNVITWSDEQFLYNSSVSCLSVITVSIYFSDYVVEPIMLLLYADQTVKRCLRQACGTSSRSSSGWRYSQSFLARSCWCWSRAARAPSSTSISRPTSSRLRSRSVSASRRSSGRLHTSAGDTSTRLSPSASFSLARLASLGTSTYTRPDSL